MLQAHRWCVQHCALQSRWQAAYQGFCGGVSRRRAQWRAAMRSLGRIGPPGMQWQPSDAWRRHPPGCRLLAAPGVEGLQLHAEDHWCPFTASQLFSHSEAAADVMASAGGLVGVQTAQQRQQTSQFKARGAAGAQVMHAASAQKPSKGWQAATGPERQDMQGKGCPAVRQELLGCGMATAEQRGANGVQERAPLWCTSECMRAQECGRFAHSSQASPSQAVPYLCAAALASAARA